MLRPFLLILSVLCDIGDFEHNLHSGRLVIVTSGKCNTNCLDVIGKITKISKEVYLTDLLKNTNARDYMNDLNYKGEYPVFFYKGRFLSDVRNDPELASILKGL